MMKRNCDNLIDKKSKISMFGFFSFLKNLFLLFVVVCDAKKVANLDNKRGIFLLQEYADIETREIGEHLPENVDKGNVKSLIAGAASTMMSNRIAVIGTDIRSGDCFVFYLFFFYLLD